MVLTYQNFLLSMKILAKHPMLLDIPYDTERGPSKLDMHFPKSLMEGCWNQVSCTTLLLEASFELDPENQRIGRNKHWISAV